MENNNKPFVLTVIEMKQKISGVINEYMPIVPSDIIADYLTILTSSLRQNAEEQARAAVEVYQRQQEETQRPKIVEKEVVEDGTDSAEVSSQDELRDSEADE